MNIIDCDNASIFSLGGTLVDTIKFLSNTFRCRGHHNYIVNVPSAAKFLYGMVKGALK